MAFKLHGNSKPGHNPLNFIELPVTNGETITPGELVKVVNGRITVMTTNGVVAGIFLEDAAVTGNVGGTITAKIQLLNAGDILVVAEPAGVTDGAMQEGDALDTATGGLLLAANTNSDFIVYEHDTVNSLLYVQANRRQYAN
jgi:hypothetical protein